MDFSIRLQQVLKERNCDGRGVISKIAAHTGVARHAISDMYRNRTQYLSMTTLGAVCDYLVDEVGVDPTLLPGLLFGQEHGAFWPMLAAQDSIDICVGVRGTVGDPRAQVVMAADAHLQGRLLHRISRVGIDTKEPAAYSLVQHLVDAPAEGRSRAFEQHAQAVRDAFLSSTRKRRALICLGSIRSNLVVEVVTGRAFGLTPWRSTRGSAKTRSPVYMLYREDGTKPESCCGGADHPGSKRSRSDAAPGFYIENANGSWTRCPSDDKEEPALVMYFYRPTSGTLELVMGGFSGLGTELLARALPGIPSELLAPCFEGPDLQVGVIVIRFPLGGGDGRSGEGGQSAVPRVSEDHVHRIAGSVLRKRLKR